MKPSEEDNPQYTPDEEKQLKIALTLYEKGNYAQAYNAFSSIQKQNEKLTDGLRYYIKFCKNVLNVRPNGEDQIYEIVHKIQESIYWLWLPGLYLLLPLLKLFYEDTELTFTFTDILSILFSGVLFLTLYKISNAIPYTSSYTKVKCKYCGHYTGYINPNEDYAYLGGNNCSVCGRGYPMPSISWDTNWGQTYIYERGSVTEPIFYAEFEEENPDYPKSEMANHYLKRNKRENKSKNKS